MKGNNEYLRINFLQIFFLSKFFFVELEYYNASYLIFYEFLFHSVNTYYKYGLFFFMCFNFFFIVFNI